MPRQFESFAHALSRRDRGARTWLLKLLRAYRGALVVVSHDLDLLDDAITRVIHIDRETDHGASTLFEYKGISRVVSNV